MPPIHAIQVLRALAAFMVAVHHVQPDAALLAERVGRDFARIELLPWMAGVDIFFVVSGFIMVHASGDLFGRAGAPRRFLARRLARIVPLYWAATTLFLLVGLVLPASLNSGTPDLAQIAGSYLFWPVASAGGLVQPIYSLGWTLNYEMLFYALFALALALPAAFVVPAVSLALILLVAAQVVVGPLPLPFAFWGQPIVLEFAAGMVLALLRRGGLRCPDILRWPMAASGLAILLLDRHVPVPDGPWRNLACHGGAAVLLVLAAASGRGKSEPSAPIRALARLGDASYTLYLVHPFAIRGLRELFLWVAPGWPLLYMLCALVASVLAALLVHRFFERPATELLRRWLRSRAG